jgi:hypothetical protein
MTQISMYFFKVAYIILFHNPIWAAIVPNNQTKSMFDRFPKTRRKSGKVYHEAPQITENHPFGHGNCHYPKFRNVTVKKWQHLWPLEPSILTYLPRMQFLKSYSHTPQISFNPWGSMWIDLEWPAMIKNDQLSSGSYVFCLKTGYTSKSPVVWNIYPRLVNTILQTMSHY